MKEKPMANTSRRGFASMDRSKQKEIASKGGRAAHAKGTAHEFTSDEARVAGRKGGEAVSRDRQHMSTIGREGGHSRGVRARAVSDQSISADSAQPTSQSYERPMVSERSSYEPPVRETDRSAYSAQERTSLPNPRPIQPSGDMEGRNDPGPFGGRGQI
jgi:general stress protein YciG